MMIKPYKYLSLCQVLCERERSIHVYLYHLGYEKVEYNFMAMVQKKL